jgi:hypothetical protein
MLHLAYPILGTITYLNIPKKTLQTIPKPYIRIISFFHNLALHVFSVYIFTQLFTEVIRGGAIVKQNYYCNNQRIYRLLFYFYLSKYYEYIDTMILYAKGVEPIFLQKFHHVGAVAVWHLAYINKCDGVFYASLFNSAIHSVMYFYYLLSLFPYINTMVRKYKVYITSLQLLQLTSGAIMLQMRFYPIETNINKGVILIFNSYISCLIIMFLHFMLKSYA